MLNQFIFLKIHIYPFKEDWVIRFEEGRFLNWEIISTKEIEITTLNILIGEYGITGFIKIDIEGLEL